MSRKPKTEASIWSILMRVFKLGLRHKGAFALMIVCMALLGAVSGIVTLLLQPVLVFFGTADATSLTDTDSLAMIAELKSTGLWVMILTPFAALAAWASLYVSQWVANTCMEDLRQNGIDKLLALDLGTFAGLTKGDLIQRMSGDMERCQVLLQTLYGKVQQRPWELIGTTVALFLIDWRLACVVYLGLIPFLGGILSILNKLRKRSARARQSMADLLVTFEQIAAGSRIIKSLGAAERESTRFRLINRELFNRTMRVARARAQADGVTYGLLPLIIGALLFGGPWLCANTDVAPTTLAIFLIAIMRKLQLLRTLQRAWASVMNDAPSAERIFDLLDRQPGISDAPDAQPCPMPSREIRFDRVGFRYRDDDEQVLTDCSFTIAIGSTVALVGESGSGKSTILDLVMRLYEVQEGAITIDGLDLRQMTHASLLSHFAVVQQDSFLFDDTVYANIAFGRPGASQEEIEEAARRAHVHEAILGLEGGLGYQTRVGDRGDRLSGGQRQRIAIARALLRDAPILILDEPTSALDAESEQRVQEALQELLRGRTAIVVAHRLATVQNADVIHVLDRQRRGIVESGSHQELLERSGHYARLVELQQLRDGRTPTAEQAADD